MARILDGELVAAEMRKDLGERVKALKSKGVTPKLVTVLVGDDPASRAYIGRKHEDCRALGIASEEVLLPSDCGPEVLYDQIDRLNADPAVHGFLVQLPLPQGFDEAEVLRRILPQKDIDGLHPQNLGGLVSGNVTVLPCTPAGVLALLRHYGIELRGKHVVIVGRGALVGRPLAMLLSQQGIDATVTLAHRRTADLAEITRRADIVISAAGQIDLITAQMVRKGATVVGVGISYPQGQMVSDIAADVADVAGAVTPMHGSVGALTRAMLLKNLLDFAEA